MEGYALLEKDGLFGLIDTLGNIVLDVEYREMKFRDDFIIVKKESLYGCYNNKFELIAPMKFDKLWIPNYGKEVLQVWFGDYRERRHGWIRTVDGKPLGFSYDEL